MNIDEQISANDCCDLLKVSRPTFIKKRRELGLQETISGRNTFFNRSEVLNKLYTALIPAKATVDLVMIEQNFDLIEILVDQHTMDLRRINSIDPYGLISLFCYALEKLKKQESFFFINPESSATSYLRGFGFFSELLRKFPTLLNCDPTTTTGAKTPSEGDRKIFLPITEIAYKGQDRKVTEDLLMSLLKEGFSEDMAGYLGWMIGELSDNSLTHAKGPCFLTVNRFQTAPEDHFIEIAVGDIGVGITESLRNKDRYKELSPKQAFLTAFKSGASSWPDSANRGKGLCDLLSIALGNCGFVRADSNDLSLLYNFSSGQRNVEFHKPISKVHGSRFSIILFEKDFQASPREEINSFLNREILKHE